VASAEIVSIPDARGRYLKARFFQLGDRYAHGVWLVDGGNETALLDSLEGDDYTDWPPSPPLQQLTVEDRTDGSHVLLLVGMAGTSHWSLSVEPHPSEPALLFDAACRIKGACTRLGSQYRCDLQPRPPRDSQTIEFGIADQICRFEAETLGSKPPASVEMVGENLSIHSPPLSERLPTTARWKYRIAIGLK
jgi:hypothetical protein